jgi:hypothetical protein
MPTTAERLAQLEQQQSAQTRLMRLILENRLTGDLPNAAAELVALEGGQTTIDVTLGNDSGE